MWRSKGTSNAQPVDIIQNWHEEFRDREPD